MAPLTRLSARCSIFLGIFVRGTKAQYSQLNLFNEATSPFHVLWVDSESTDADVLSHEGGVLPGRYFSFDSWPGHKFIVKELPSRDGICEYTGDQSCRQVHFTTPDSGAQSIRITPNFDVIFSNPLASNATTESPHELVASCHQRIKDRLSLDSSIHNSTSASTAVVLQALEDCVKRELVGIMERFQEDLSFHSSRRTNMAIDLENYTCLDAQMTSSSGDVYNETWTNNNKRHLVHVKLDRPASRIHVIDDFISEEECRYVESALDGPLKRAIIADGKGGATYLSSRKSLQAIISVDWTSENGEGITANLFRRVYNYTTHVLGLNVNERGQELPAVIQYDGRGRGDSEPDQYLPHCDGDCDGRLHRLGERVATILMYCSVPEDGGHTNFANAAVNVKPKLGSALFFSYMDPGTRLMDDGLTRHSGCPVFAGTKKVVLQVVRYGVDDETPWNTWNSLGVRHDEALDYD